MSRQTSQMAGTVISNQYLRPGPDTPEKERLIMTDLLADAGYSNGSNYKFLEQKGITGWIPVFGKYKHEIECFRYNKEKDEYTCPRGKSLPFKGFHTNLDGTVLKNYWEAPERVEGLPHAIRLRKKKRYVRKSQELCLMNNIPEHMSGSKLKEANRWKN